MHELTKVYLGNPLWSWILTAAAGAGIVGGAALLRRLLASRLLRGKDTPSQGTEHLLLRMIRSTSVLLVAGISYWLAAIILSLPE